MAAEARLGVLSRCVNVSYLFSSHFTAFSVEIVYLKCLLSTKMSNCVPQLVLHRIGHVLMVDPKICDKCFNRVKVLR